MSNKNNNIGDLPQNPLDNINDLLSAKEFMEYHESVGIFHTGTLLKAIVKIINVILNNLIRINEPMIVRKDEPDTKRPLLHIETPSGYIPVVPGFIGRKVRYHDDNEIFTITSEPYWKLGSMAWIVDVITENEEPGSATLSLLRPA